MPSTGRLPVNAERMLSPRSSETEKLALDSAAPGAPLMAGHTSDESFGSSEHRVDCATLARRGSPPRSGAGATRRTVGMGRSAHHEQTWEKSSIGHFIGGEWVEAESGRCYQNRSPWSGEVLSEVAAGDGEDTRRAIEAAQDAFPGW